MKHAARLWRAAGVALLPCLACSESERPPSSAAVGAQGAPATSAAAEQASGGTPPSAASAAGALPLELRECAQARGLLYSNVSGQAHKPTILEANGAGVALLDLHNDGDLDVLFAQGLPSLAALCSGPLAQLSVWHNDGSAHFSPAAAPAERAWWTGLASGDLDNDGDCDLVAGAYGDLQCFVQAPDGSLVAQPDSGLLPPATEAPQARFTPAARAPQSPQAQAPWWVSSLALCDLDNDGVLDLYVGQYLDFDAWNPPLGQLGEGALAIPCRWKNAAVYCGPRGLKAQPDRCLRGTGPAAFEDQSARWLAGHVPAYTLAMAPFDADQDGDTDLYVANDSAPNLMLINEISTRGQLLDLGATAGVAVDMDGRVEAGMGVAVGDVNRDGLPDLALTNFSDEPTQLYFGAPQGFRCMTYRLGLSRETKALLSWSVHLVDFDADGWLELFQVNGHVYPQADLEGTGTRYAQEPTLYRILPERPVERVRSEAPDSLLAQVVGARGSAAGDLDGDGDFDLVLARIDAPAALGLTECAKAGQRLLIRCEGSGESLPTSPRPRRSPRDAKGTRVRVLLEDGSFLCSEVQSCVGYQSASSSELHFGLGAKTRFAGLEVRWPSGRVERLPGGAAGRRLHLLEGSGCVGEEALP